MWVHYEHKNGKTFSGSRKPILSSTIFVTSKKIGPRTKWTIFRHYKNRTIKKLNPRAFYICLIEWICHFFAMLKTCFGLLYSKPMLTFFFAIKKGPRLKWTTYKHVSDKSKKCLSLILEFCLSSSLSAFVLAPAYISLCSGLEYLLKVRYIIVVDSKEIGFFHFWNCFPVQGGNTALRLKNISQKWAEFAFGSTYLHQTFTECVSNQYAHFYIFTCQI